MHMCIYSDIYIAGFVHFKLIKMHWFNICFSKHNFKVRLTDLGIMENEGGYEKVT